MPLPIAEAGPAVEDGELKAFGLKRVTRRVWALEPSLNIPGEIHGYVTLVDVPEPAPWERTIMLATEIPGGMVLAR